MIDIHSHIIPSVDDGSDSMEMSIKMLKMAEESGTKTIVATPHYIKGIYENEYDTMFEKYEKLKIKAKAAGLNIEILFGQEIMLDKYSLQLCREKRLRGINSTRYILVEFPMYVMPQDALDLIYELRVLGYLPIIAHPERYTYIYENPANLNEFIEEGCYFQINTGSLSGFFGKDIKAAAKFFIKQGLADFIASDAHSLNTRSTAALGEFYNEKSASNSDLMLKDKEINVSRDIIKKRSKLTSFFK